MGLIAALIFIAVFTLIALPLVGSALSPSRIAASAGHAGLCDQGREPGDAPAEPEPAQGRESEQHPVA